MIKYCHLSKIKSALFSINYPKISLLLFLPLSLLNTTICRGQCIEYEALETAKYGTGAAFFGTNTTTLTINKPTGTVLNDFLLLAIATDGSTNFSTPSGWTELDQRTISISAASMGIYYKIATASEPNDYTITWSSEEEATATIIRYSGINTSNPINTFDVDTGNTVNPTAPTITTTATDVMVVRIYGADDDRISGSPYPAGLTPRVNFISADGWGTSTLGIADLMQSPVGATGSAAFTLSASQEWAAATIALNAVCSVEQTSSSSSSSCSSGLLSNADFSADLSDWVDWGFSSIQTASDGNKYARIMGGAGGFGQDYASTAGTSYRLSFLGKKEASEFAGGGFAFYDASWNKIGIDQAKTITSTDFQEYSVSFTAPANTAWIQTWGFKDPGTGFADYDDFCLSIIQPEDCTNNLDDDGDGLIDSEDPDCGPNCLLWNPYPGFAIDFSDNQTKWSDYNLSENLILINNKDGTMTISGTIENGTPVDFGFGSNGTSCGTNDSWLVQMTLSDKKSWTEWQAMGGIANVHGSCAGAEANLDFWQVVGTLTGTGCNIGRSLTITNPSPPYRLQIGNGGNNGDGTCSFGMSTWFEINEGGAELNADIYAFLDQSCYIGEICGNNIDDDNNGNMDCDDSVCGRPNITAMTPSNPNNCPDLNNGQIAISADGTNLEYSINNGVSYQASNIFANLSSNIYTIRVRNSNTGCSINHTAQITLTDESCAEDCTDTDDNDGDGDVDCADSDCSPIITSVTPSNPSNCPALNDGEVIISANGANLEYSINNGSTYQSSNIFTNLSAGTFNIRVRNSSTGCYINYSSSITITNPTCVESIEICGTVWEDSNHNGNIDDGINSLLGGIKVELYACNNALLGTTYTDASGNYLFIGLEKEPFISRALSTCQNDLPAATYQVKFLLADCPKWTQCSEVNELTVSAIEKGDCTNLGLVSVN